MSSRRTHRWILAAASALAACVSISGCDKAGVGGDGESICGAASGATSFVAADQLFRRDPNWLGGDGAYSVTLGNGRVLWMFGDSFVSKDGSPSRRKAAFVRNTVGVQTGIDPSAASLQFFWRGGTTAPSSFVAEASPNWYWPMGGANAKGRIFLFYVAEKAVSGGLGFEAAGNRLVTVDDPSGPPLGWVLTERTFSVPPSLRVTLLAPFVDDDTMYVYAIRDPGDHGVFVAKVTVTHAVNGDFSGALWWCGDRGWRDATDVGASPTVVFPSATTTDNPAELSVARRPDGTYIAVHSVGFGATKIALRTAPRPEGPWTEPCPFFTPPESNTSNPFVYAGKGHAELDGADLVATYVTNSFESQKTYDDMSLYYPRFVRASLTTTPSKPKDASAE
ncbi:hypothetical protein BH09MYX1_BH09MYX1_36840 [soil metagenome]